jgi:hypothetical protein
MAPVPSTVSLTMNVMRPLYPGGRHNIVTGSVKRGCVPGKPDAMLCRHMAALTLTPFGGLQAPGSLRRHGDGPR